MKLVSMVFAAVAREEGARVLNARLWRLFAIASVAVIAGVTIITAQTATPSGSTNSPMDQLLAEVRGLRAEVNQAASASVRAQLLVARLQLQEQRINVLAGQLVEVRRLMQETELSNQLTAEQGRWIDFNARLDDLERQLLNR